VYLRNKIEKKKVSVAVLGMGYVGLPLALIISKSGFKVVGIDVDDTKVGHINHGKSYIEYIKDEEIRGLTESGLLGAQAHCNNLEQFDVIIICVPTPLTKNKEPDLSHIISAVDVVSQHLRKGQIIILESTTFPGTTEEVVLPKLARSGMEVGKDFYLGFSPERVDPGNHQYTTRNTPKIVSGMTEKCSELIYAFYSQFIENVYKVSSTKTAEMAKLYENTFRHVNIALVNQLSLLCHKLGIDTNEVIKAASTKPFGFMPFYHGPGVGGHCIPVDPLYLLWKAKEYDMFLSLIETAEEVNCAMPQIVIERITDILNGHGKALSHSTLLVLGVAYKKNISDVRESPALKIIKELQDKGCKVLFNDPYVKEIDIDDHKYVSQELDADLLKNCDCTVIITPHDSYDFDWIVKHSKVVFDTRNATEKVTTNPEKIIKL